MGDRPSEDVDLSDEKVGRWAHAFFAEDDPADDTLVVYLAEEVLLLRRAISDAENAVLGAPPTLPEDARLHAALSPLWAAARGHSGRTDGAT